MPRPVWASTRMEFQFHGRDAVYQELASTPGLHARIGFDRANNQVIGVTFKGRQ